MRFLIGSLVAIVCLGQDTSVPHRPIVRATGDATISARPDQARINIGVVAEAQSAEAAGAQNAERSNAVITVLRKLLGQTADIHTVNYSLNPAYKYIQGESPIITGYTANNTVQVRITDLAAIGKAIDAVTKTGANNINGIEFELRDPQAVRAEAVKQAASKARANAEAIAAALGLRVVGVLSAESQDVGGVRPMVMAMAAQRSAVPTPVEAGSIEVQAHVTVTLEVAATGSR